MRGASLRVNASAISPTAFRVRKERFSADAEKGAFLAEPENRGKPPPNPMTDPAMMEGMMGMMKGNVAMMVSQSLIMGWINAFFSGFVISTYPSASFGYYKEAKVFETQMRGSEAGYYPGSMKLIYCTWLT
jgi:hypothetical protein